MQLEFEAGNDKEYEINSIQDNAIYTKESTISQLPRLYYLVSWKGYPEEENTWEPTSAIQQLRRLVIVYHKDIPKKPTAISLPVDTAPPLASPIQGRPAGPMTAPTKKRGQLAGSTTTSKQAKKFQTSLLLNSLLVIFLKKYPTCRLGSFSSITLHRSFDFSPQYSH